MYHLERLHSTLCCVLSDVVEDWIWTHKPHVFAEIGGKWCVIISKLLGNVEFRSSLHMWTRHCRVEKIWWYVKVSIDNELESLITFSICLPEFYLDTVTMVRTSTLYIISMNHSVYSCQEHSSSAKSLFKEMKRASEQQPQPLTYSCFHVTLPQKQSFQVRNGLIRLDFVVVISQGLQWHNSRERIWYTYLSQAKR